MDEIQKRINDVYIKAFGETSLDERLNDIRKEAGELGRFTTIKSLRGEASDLAGTLTQLCTECGWSLSELLEENAKKIESREAQYRALGRKYKVAILGGAFDPITTGHIGVAKYVLDESKEFDEVWLMPCFQHMNGKKMTTPNHRLNMVKLACECDGRLQSSGYEIDNQLAGETFYLVKRLMAEPMANDRYNVSLIIGQDNANSFDKWVNFEYLQKAIRFVVVPRKGIEPNPRATWYRNGFHICMEASENLEQISSTEVRHMLKENNPRVAEFLDPKVLSYIKENGLYS